MFTSTRSISNSSESITSHNTVNSNLAPGTWIKRPVSRVSGHSSLRTPVGLVTLVYHHAVIVYGNIIIEFQYNPELETGIHSSALIAESAIHEWSVVRTPTDEAHSKLIIKRALTKYGVREAYNLSTNNCEHFAHFCYFGRKRCKQIQSLLYSNGMGFAGATAFGLIKASLFNATSPSFDVDPNILTKVFREHIASGVKSGVKGFYDFTILNARFIWSWYHNSTRNWFFLGDRVIVLDLAKYALLKNTAIYGSLFWISGYVLCYLCFPTMRQMGSIEIQSDQTKVIKILTALGVFDEAEVQNREKLQKKVAKIIF